MLFVFILLGFLIFLCVIVVTVFSDYVEEEAEKNRLLTIFEYRKKYPHCITTEGMRCCVCNSASLQSIAKYGKHHRVRFCVCNHCGTHLYETNT
jgi:hypothetical protein